VALPITFAADGPITVEGRPYRGGIEVRPGEPAVIINRVDVESYVAGVINHEIDSRWSPAAVDALSILIRTYALKRCQERKGELFDLDRTTTDQVYGGLAAVDDLALAAAERTRGRVMTFEGELILGLYHACCGGHTEVPSAVWGGHDLAWQRSVACPYCQDAPRYFWRYPEQGALSRKELASLLGLSGEVHELTVSARTISGRAAMIRVLSSRGGSSFTGQEFRKLLGYDRLFSTAFEIETVPEGFVFRGSGAGHGVGLCQWGARGMAAKGFSAPAILSYYYPGIKVERIPGQRH
jgi:stage II sporulation protein D